MNLAGVTVVHPPVYDKEMDSRYHYCVSNTLATLECWPAVPVTTSQCSTEGYTHVISALNGDDTHQTRPFSTIRQTPQQSLHPLPPETFPRFPQHQYQLAPGNCYSIARGLGLAPEPPTLVFQSNHSATGVGGHSIQPVPEIEPGLPPEPHRHPAAHPENYAEALGTGTRGGPVLITKLSRGFWRCLVCYKVLRRKQLAMDHVQTAHRGVAFQCSGSCGAKDCHKAFASQDGLGVHRRPIKVACPDWSLFSSWV